jgi:putative transposase
MSKKAVNKNVVGGFDFSAIEAQIQQHAKQFAGNIAIGGNDFIKELMSRTYKALLEAEMDEHLGYSKHEELGDGSGNARNGYGKKTIKGEFGEAEIPTPRDRNASFDPQIIKKRSSTVGNFSEKIISLYARGMSTEEISSHLHEIYGVELSDSFVSRAVSTIQAEVNDWQRRPLSALYPILYVDGIRFNVRSDGKIIKKCFYTVLGVNIEGKQDVLGLWIADNEGASFWLSVLNELKNRGVEDVLIACVDGLVGMPDAIEAVFPQAQVQLCIVHQIRNCCKHISYKDRKALCNDMKLIYQAPSLSAAEQGLENLRQNWGAKHPMVIRSWESKWANLVGFLQYPAELRKITYTTNAIESLHSLLRKNTSSKKIFPNDDSLFRILYLNIKNLSIKWTKRQGWNSVCSQLSIIFGDRFNKFADRILEN